MNYIRAAINWGHVALRAAPWGTFSVTMGPLTRGKASHFAMRQWCVGASDGLGIRRTLVNGHRLPAPQCVFIANHLSLLDILVLGSYMKQDYRWLSKEAIFKVPFLGWHLKSSGHIPVYRGEKRHLNKDLPKRIHRVIEEGASVLFFPEGTRSRDGLLKPFKLGAFYAAVDEQLPVVPLVLRGTDELMHKGAMDLAIDAERQCSVTVLEPLIAPQPTDSSEEARKQAASDLRDMAFTAIADELGPEKVGDKARELGGRAVERDEQVASDRPTSGAAAHA